MNADPLDEIMNRGPAKRVHEFKKPSPGEPWFTAPVARFAEMIEPFALGLRTLPDVQFHAERELLAGICAKPDHHVAHRLVLRIFDAEKVRRTDPARQFDDQLDAALSRLERATNEDDRKLVWMIGTDLFAIGGFEAMRAAERRSVAVVDPDRQDLRQRILQKRWTGIGAAGVGSRRP